LHIIDGGFKLWETFEMARTIRIAPFEFLIQAGGFGSLGEI
jgi:hypothetical protein